MELYASEGSLHDGFYMLQALAIRIGDGHTLWMLWEVPGGGGGTVVFF